jgi:hypothetical protein
MPRSAPFTKARGLVLDVHLSPQAATRLVEATKEGIGRLQLAVLVNSGLAAASPIVQPLTSGRRVQIGLDLPVKIAEEVAASIAARWPQ